MRARVVSVGLSPIMANSNTNPATVVVASHSNKNVTAHQQQTDRHYTNISNAEAAVISTFIASVIAVFGWIVVHRNTRSREREAREHADLREKEQSRATLLHTLKHWENTFVVILDPRALANLYYEGGGMRALAEAAELFRRYVPDKTTFDRLNHQMSAMNPQVLDANGQDRRRDTICGGIRNFYDFIRAA